MPPRYSRNRHPLWLRLQMLQIWINEKQFVFAHKLRRRLARLPFARGRLSRNPSSGPQLLTNPYVVTLIIIVLGFMLIFGEGLLNRFQIVEMMTGIDLNKSAVENAAPR